VENKEQLLKEVHDVRDQRKFVHRCYNYTADLFAIGLFAMLVLSFLYLKHILSSCIVVGGAIIFFTLAFIGGLLQDEEQDLRKKLKDLRYELKILRLKEKLANEEK